MQRDKRLWTWMLISLCQKRRVKTLSRCLSWALLLPESILKLLPNACVLQRQKNLLMKKVMGVMLSDTLRSMHLKSNSAHQCGPSTGMTRVVSLDRCLHTKHSGQEKTVRSLSTPSSAWACFTVLVNLTRRHGYSMACFKKAVQSR